MTWTARHQLAESFEAAFARVDWAATPLGAMASWSPSLGRAVDLALQTRFPVTLFWGSEFVMVYNEAYVELIGDKHPAALGSRAVDVFPEAWDVIGPMMQSVLEGNGATWVENALVPLQRRGFLEECYFTFSYSAVRGDDGDVEGVIDIAAETTTEVLQRRRLALLARLTAALADLDVAAELPRFALPVLRVASADLPVVDIRPGGPSAVDPDPRLPSAPSVRLLSGSDLLVETVGTRTVAWLPLGGDSAGPRSLLVVQLSDQLPPDEDYLSFLRLVAATLVHALQRAHVRESERRTVAAHRGMSEALQRSLLTQPPVRRGLEMAVRYHPAAEQAHIGGDWYDAFELADGNLALVVGDVAGHDQAAATAMAHVRNLLRGVAYTLEAGPGVVLSGLDRAISGLGVETFATAVVGELGPAQDDGGRHLYWSNAGHPPPVLLTPDGRARLLQGSPDVLLGLATGTPRTDHAIRLPAGAVLVLYTDGLVERRGENLDDSFDWLTGALAGRQEMTPDEICDHLLGEVGPHLDDDIALLVVRTAP